MATKKTFFLTGATGLVGSYLLKILLDNGHKVYALCRGGRSHRQGNSFIERREWVSKRVSFWDERTPLDNLFVLEGDVVFPDMGLNDVATRIIASEVDEIFHCAAITDLNRPGGEIEKVNVEGTRNVLEFALKLKEDGKLSRLNHISTTYVYGDYNGVFNEDDLILKQNFKTEYEKSKFLAEKLSCEYRDKGLWVDIYRPPLVLGESKEGKTFQFKHLYQFMHLCARDLFDALPVKGAYATIVPVDGLSQAIYILSMNATEKNKTYHPFPNMRFAFADLMKIGSKVLNFKMPKLVALKDFDLARLTPIQRMILQNSLLFINFKTRIDSKKTNDRLKKLKFSFPRMDSKLCQRICQYAANGRVDIGAM